MLSQCQLWIDPVQKLMWINEYMVLISMTFGKIETGKQYIHSFIYIVFTPILRIEDLEINRIKCKYL